eukprot:1159106-Pelagomonas_calceolata.AAC.6
MAGDTVGAWHRTCCGNTFSSAEHRTKSAGWEQPIQEWMEKSRQWNASAAGERAPELKTETNENEQAARQVEGVGGREGRRGLTAGK